MSTISEPQPSARETAPAYFLRIKEFGRRNGFSESFVYKLIRNGELRAVKIGGSTRITLDDETSFKSSQKARSAKTKAVA